MCILATIMIGAIMAFIAYDKMTDYGTLPDDGNMSGPGY